jgi:hypothetical protein
VIPEFVAKGIVLQLVGVEVVYGISNRVVDVWWASAALVMGYDISA